MNLILVILPAGAGVCQYEIGVCGIGIPEKGFSRAFLRLVHPIQMQEGHAQDDVTIRRIRVEFQASPDRGFRFGRVSLQIMEVTDAKHGFSVAAATENHGFLKRLHGLLQLS